MARREDEGLRTEEIAAAGERDAPQGDLSEDARIDEVEAQAGRRASEPVAASEPSEPLLAGEELERFRSRWEDIQASFVDEPRRSVEQADGLVAEVMQRLAGSFSDERSRLESQWDRGEQVSTEDLRVALTRYRSFFNRLLEA
jgi:hypothetical protein